METHLEFYRRWAELEKPYLKWQFEQFRPYLGQRVADAGCGLGNFFEFLQDRELYLGFEPDPELAQEFRALHSSDSARLATHGDITLPEAVAEMKQHRVDSVICVNVLEHIEQDKLALSNLVDGVAPEGVICILVPAFSFLYGTLDKWDGHYRRYSKKDLPPLIADLPVKLLKSYYMNLIGAFGWFLKGRILKQKAQADCDYKTVNMLLPFIRRMESIWKPCFGMSLIAILRKNLQ